MSTITIGFKGILTIIECKQICFAKNDNFISFRDGKLADYFKLYMSITC